MSAIERLSRRASRWARSRALALRTESWGSAIENSYDSNIGDRMPAIKMADDVWTPGSGHSRQRLDIVPSLQPGRHTGIILRPLGLGQHGRGLFQAQAIEARHHEPLVAHRGQPGCNRLLLIHVGALGLLQPVIAQGVRDGDRAVAHRAFEQVLPALGARS